MRELNVPSVPEAGFVRARGRRRIAMTMRSAGQPDEATRRAARKLAMLAGACLVPALVAQALFLPGGNREIAIPITAAIGLALLASLWVDVDVAVPYSAGELLARVRERGTVELDYRPSDVRVRGRISPPLAGELETVAARWREASRTDNGASPDA